MAHPQLALGVLQAAFDRPATKRHRQDCFQRRARRGIGQEVLFLGRIEHVADPHQPVRSQRAAVTAQPQRHRLGVPDHRPAAAVFDVIPRPRHVAHVAGIAAEVLDGFRSDRRRRSRPETVSAEVAGHFHDVTQAAILQSLQKRRSLRVPLVGRKPREHHAVANGAIDLLQRDPMFGTIDDIVGNARFLPTLRISPSMFGKKERAVEQRPKRTVVRGVGQMHRDHAVVDLAGVAAVLPLDAGGVRALLGGGPIRR